ncbi:MAG TPA: tetratricopeptide repeat protein [Terracidiphilus sp.]
MGLLILSVLLTAATASAQDDPAMQTLRHAVELQQSGHYAEAIDGYQSFLKAHPDAGPVRSNLGAALAHEGRYIEAIREYTLALKSDPANNGIRFNLALAYYKAGHIPDAVREFEAVYAAQTQSDPNHERLALLLAECYLRQGENARVISLLDPMATSDQNNPALDYELGTALLHEGQTERGALLIERLLKNGDTAQAHMLMAYTRYQAHDKGAAMVEVNQAIAIDPNLPEAYSLKGRLAFLESDMKGAEASFRKALTLDGNNFEALLWSGTLLRQEGRLEESQKFLSHAVELQPAEVRARYQFARVCSDLGDDKRAAELLEALIKDHPEYTEAHRSLVTIFFRLGRADDGRRERKIVEQMDVAIRQKNEDQGRSMQK